MHRINVTLDDESARKLSALAARAHINEGTLARSLLSRAVDMADPDAALVTQLLDGMDGAFDRAQLGIEQSKQGQTISLDEL